MKTQNKCVVVRFGELTLKGKNRDFFEKSLLDDIRNHLIFSNLDFKIEKDRNRIYIFGEDLKKIQEELFFVAGIKSTSCCYVCEKNIDSIFECVKQVILEKDIKNCVVMIDVKRSDKSFSMKSPELGKEICSRIEREFPERNIVFSFHNYSRKIFIEIQPKYALVFDEKIQHLGGLPINTAGKGLLLLSGGIDSSVAGILAMRRGIAVDSIFFDTLDDEFFYSKLIILAKRLRKFCLSMKLFYVPYFKFFEYVFNQMNNRELKYGCLICKRGMFYLSSKLAKRIGAELLITGENLSQVASQTLQNMICISKITDYLVLRPLICYDKEEIINYSKFLRIHDVINIKSEKKCILLHDHPVTRAALDEVVKLENKLNTYKFLDLIFESIKEVDLN
ncbi:MAG: tRNA uracil 4-sulfurtransferase ThiI [Candidatus Woesearchaeota archaeon]